MAQTNRNLQFRGHVGDAMPHFEIFTAPGIVISANASVAGVKGAVVTETAARFSPNSRVVRVGVVFDGRHGSEYTATVRVTVLFEEFGQALEMDGTAED